MSQLTPEMIEQAIPRLRRGDPQLKAVIDRVGPFRLKRQTNRYQSLLRAIIAQQISTAAARSIWNKLEQAAGTSRPTPESIARLSDPQLRGVGISPQKLGYVRSLTDHVLDGKLRLAALHRLPDEEVIEELVQVKGIGLWTAQMFLIFSLGRADVLPHGDLGIQTAIRRVYELNELPKRDSCERIARPWRPYSTVACWYLWRSLEFQES